MPSTLACGNNWLKTWPKSALTVTFAVSFYGVPAMMLLPLAVI
jgi:hypothetical protein